MSYSDEETNSEYLKINLKKEKDLYLLETVKLLNEGCINAVKFADPTKQEEYCTHFYSWNITDIDYDFQECRKYCLISDAWDICPMDFWLCDSCEKILKQRIQEPFTKSKSELIYDMILLQEKMNYILERLDKLEAKKT